MSFLSKLLAGSAMLASLSAMAYTECRATSPHQTVALIELYTSEGCDSCPPADRWLSAVELSAESGIALALHVDYWDRLGWKDRFASATYTQRQYEQKRRQGSEYVYTPQVLLQGRDFRQWGVRGEPGASIAAINQRPARAVIELAVERRGTDARVEMHASVPDARDRPRAVVNVALVQDRLVSQVTGGENRGKRLTHDHVVRQWHAGPRPDTAGRAHEQFTFALPAEAGPLSIVAFAEDSQTGDVLQAVVLPMCTGN